MMCGEDIGCIYGVFNSHSCMFTDFFKKILLHPPLKGKKYCLSSRVDLRIYLVVRYISSTQNLKPFYKASKFEV